MVLDGWDEMGDAQQTERWRSVLPALSPDSAEDQTGMANTAKYVAAIRQRYVLEIKRLSGPRGQPPPTLLPRGALFLSGVPLVIHRLRPYRPLPGDANARWPGESDLPVY